MTTLKSLAYLGLILTILPSFLYLFGIVSSFGIVKTSMLIGMIVWYLAATPWLAFQSEKIDDSTQDQI